MNNDSTTTHLTVRELIKQLLDCNMDDPVCIEPTGNKASLVHATKAGHSRLLGTTKYFACIEHNGESVED